MNQNINNLLYKSLNIYDPDITDLFNLNLDETRDMTKGTALAALSNLQLRTDKAIHAKKWVFFHKYNRSKRDALQKRSNEIDQKIKELGGFPTRNISSADEALCTFYAHFKENLQGSPKKLDRNEAQLIHIMSNCFWEHSKNYEKYEKLMIEFYIGSHVMVVLDEHEESMQERIEKALPKGEVQDRVSSHHVQHIGEEKHRHVMGRQLPEILFHEKRGINGEERRIFWIQTERTPDGKNIVGWLKDGCPKRPTPLHRLKHRTIDFVPYWIMKKLGCGRPQVANYQSRKSLDPVEHKGIYRVLQKFGMKPGQRGRPDTNPIRLSHQ